MKRIEIEDDASLVDALEPEMMLELQRVFDSRSIEIITGRAHPALAQKVADILKIDADQTVTRFPDGEARIKIHCELNKKDVFIIQPTSPPDGDNYLIELFLMIDAAKRASAGKLIAVLPYFGYGRQDWKEQSGVPISSAAIAHLIKEAGADHLVTLDIHSNQSQGFVGGPWDNLAGSKVLVPRLRQEFEPTKTVLVSPDASGVKRAEKYAMALQTPYIAVVYKDRDIHTGKTTAIHMSGGEYLEGRDVLIVDDMLASGGSAINAAVEARKHGARRVWFAATHGLFLDNALDEIWKSPIDKVLVTDTIAHRRDVVDNLKVEVVTVAPLLAEAIQRIHTGKVMGDLFEI